MINNAIISKYKKVTKQIKKQINVVGKWILKNKKIANRLEINSKNNKFLTQKTREENFNNNPTARLINLAKSELVCISKAIFHTGNKNMRETMSLKQYRNRDTIIGWFKGIHNKPLNRFVIFYSSITENLLKTALTVAKAHTLLPDGYKAIIHHAGK